MWQDKNASPFGLLTAISIETAILNASQLSSDSWVLGSMGDGRLERQCVANRLRIAWVKFAESFRRLT